MERNTRRTNRNSRIRTLLYIVLLSVLLVSVYHGVSGLAAI